MPGIETFGYDADKREMNPRWWNYFSIPLFTYFAFNDLVFAASGPAKSVDFKPSSQAPIVLPYINPGNPPRSILQNSLVQANSPYCAPQGPATPFSAARQTCPYPVAPVTGYFSAYQPSYCGAANGYYGTPCPSNQNGFLNSLLSKVLPALFGGGKESGGLFGDNARDSYGAPRGSTGTVGSGTLDPCGVMLPTQVQSAKEEAFAYRRTCAKTADRGPNQKIVINDYSYQTRPPQMYIFNSAGVCIGKTAVTYGSGRTGPDGKPIPCSEDHHRNMDDGYMTPPGFHLTAEHTGGEVYNSTNSLLMVGLEGQGRDHQGRPCGPADSPAPVP